MFRPGKTLPIALLTGRALTALALTPLALTPLALTACDPATAEKPTAAAPTGSGAPAAPASSAPAAAEGPSRVDVCTTVSVALADGSVEIADNAVKSIDEQWSIKKVDAELRASFDGMARKLKAEAAKVTDPELKSAVDATVAELAKGAKSTKPADFLKNEFQTLAKRMDKVCTP